MKVLYLDCGMGAAGDMLTAALLELLPEPESFLEELNSIGIPKVEFKKENSVKCGICGTHMSVKIDGMEEGEEECGHSHGNAHGQECGHSHGNAHGQDGGHSHEHSHSHTSLREIEALINGLKLSEKVKQDVISVYGLIAEAESHVHGKPVTEIHFHEVGMMDAVADVTAVCMLMDRLAPDEIVASPVHVGSGQVRCAHGIIPVPAPAAAYILKDVPIYGGSIKGELTTPTGAALLKYFASRFGDMPVMRLTATGYGMGKKDFPAANCVRAMLGETEGGTDCIYELSCNVDDMTAEAVAYASERLFEAGARDVYTVSCGMKKSRQGMLICVLCSEDDKEEMIRLLFKHTSTIGIRENAMRRYVLDRSFETVSTQYGNIRRKLVSGYGVTRYKYEYDDLAKLAAENKTTIEEIKRLADETVIRLSRQ